MPVGKATLGRIMDVLGTPQDNPRRRRLAGDPLVDPPPGAVVRRAVRPGNDLLVTGIKVIDLLVPFAKGGKVGLFGGAGVGKTINMLELINNIANGTAACRCSPASASAPARATTSTTR